MLSQLVANAMHSTRRVCGRVAHFLYFCLIVVTSFARIKKGDHMRH